VSRAKGTDDPFLAAPSVKGRGLAFLRFLAFVVLSSVLAIGTCLLLAWLLVSFGVIDTTTRTVPIEGAMALQVASQTLGALVATALMAWVGGRSLLEFGWSGDRRLRSLLIGIASGFALMVLLLVALHFVSAFAVDRANPVDAQTVVSGACYALLMVGVAVSEESLFRGYALTALSQSISFWPAAVTMSILFALAHALNPGETFAGMVSVVIFGLVLAYSYRRTGSLWFAVGLHGSWDYAESFVFGVPNSGIVMSGSLLHGQFHGPTWLTGGSAGPEGSVFVPFVLLAIPLIVSTLWRGDGQAGAAESTLTMPTLSG
jgi:membrane protease YdiL (CAAX protease family)